MPEAPLLRSLVGIFAALTLAVPAGAQRTPVFRAQLDLVEVTVTVRDAHGNLVGNLASSDFVVREDGRPQRVEVFAAAAAQIHTGERAPHAADLHCTRCGEVIGVTEGQVVPECPRGHRTFDIGERGELALTLGMLFDTSESMRKELKLSQESAVRFLDAIPRARDLMLVFFDQDIRLSRYNSENQQGIFERILDTKGAGMTALYDAIAIYLSRVGETSGRKVLVLFTDGDDTTSRLQVEEVLRLVRSSAVTIYSVAFRGDPSLSRTQDTMKARAFLSELAVSTGGQVFQPGASKELAAIYQKILDELSSQYVLGYTSDNAARDGRYRRLTVEVAGPGLRVRHRPGYYAPRDEPPKALKR